MGADRFHIEPLSEGEITLLRSMLKAAERGEAVNATKKGRTIKSLDKKVKTLAAKVANAEKKRV